MKRLNWIKARPLGWLAALVTMVTFASIAFAGGLGNVVVESTPPGAQVKLGAQVVSNTPATLSVPADGSSVRIILTKSGYKDKVITVTPKEGKTTRIKATLAPR